MACCGKNRERVRQIKGSLPEYEPGSSTQVYFRYTGKTGLNVIGPRTNKRYRFDSPGVVVAVDFMDRNAMAAIPMLREVEKPNDNSTGK